MQVYAPGFRNPYDLVGDGDRGMYALDNGGNAGWGDVPVNEGPGHLHQRRVERPDAYGGRPAPHRRPGYYAGHPNPTAATPRTPSS